jgi:hypothetical protein
MVGKKVIFQEKSLVKHRARSNLSRVQVMPLRKRNAYGRNQVRRGILEEIRLTGWDDRLVDHSARRARREVVILLNLLIFLVYRRSRGRTLLVVDKRGPSVYVSWSLRFIRVLVVNLFFFLI